jgi:hypothetical protein
MYTVQYKAWLQIQEKIKIKVKGMSTVKRSGKDVNKIFFTLLVRIKGAHMRECVQSLTNYATSEIN